MTERPDDPDVTSQRALPEDDATRQRPALSMDDEPTQVVRDEHEPTQVVRDTTHEPTQVVRDTTHEPTQVVRDTTHEPTRVLPAPGPRPPTPSESPHPSPPEPTPPPVTVGGGQTVPPAPLGPDGRKQIQTLPPLDEAADVIPISESTGQPRRDPSMIVAGSFLYAAAVVSFVAWFKAWWDAITIDNWYTSTQMTRWWLTRPGSTGSVLIAIAMAAICAITVAAPAITAFQAWNGYRWSRIAGYVTIGLLGLGIFMVPVLSWLPILLAVIGVALLHLPAVSTYFDHWQRFRQVDPPRPTVFTRVAYGPLERYR